MMFGIYRENVFFYIIQNTSFTEARDFHEIFKSEMKVQILLSFIDNEPKKKE